MGQVLGHYAGRCLLHLSERRVSLRDIELDPACAADRGVCNFSFAVLESFGHDDLDAMLRAGHRVLDRLNIALQDSRDRQLCPSLRFIELKLDRCEDRIEHLRHDQTDDVEDCPVRGVLTGDDLEQGVPLLGSRPLIYDRLNCSIAFMKRSGEIHRDEKLDAIELDASEVALRDVHSKQALAPSLGWTGIEIARATVIAAAALEPVAFETPIGVWHSVLPSVDRPHK